MAKYEFHGKVEAEHLQIGDYNIMRAQDRVAELAGTVDQCVESIRDMEATIADLRAELATANPDRRRLQTLLIALRTGAGSMETVAASVHSLQQAFGQRR
jgi:multidrug resistance efflux pump